MDNAISKYKNMAIKKKEKWILNIYINFKLLVSNKPDQKKY